jgi:chromosome segregation ATPase
MQRDHDVLKTNYQLLMQEKERLIEDNQSLESRLADKERSIQDLQENIRSKETASSLNELEIRKCQEELVKLEKEKIERINMLNTLQEEYNVLQDSLKKLVSGMDGLRSELANEKKLHNALVAKVKKFQEEARLSTQTSPERGTPSTFHKAFNLLDKDSELPGSENEPITNNQRLEEETTTEYAILVAICAI